MGSKRRHPCHVLADRLYRTLERRRSMKRGRFTPDEVDAILAAVAALDRVGGNGGTVRARPEVVGQRSIDDAIAELS